MTRHHDAEDDRYEFVDLRDQPPVEDEPDTWPDGDVDQPDHKPTRTTRTPAAARIRMVRKKPAKRGRTTRSTSNRSRSGARRSREYAIGALVCMAAAGYAVYQTTYELAGYPRDFCLVAGGLAAGLATWTPRGMATLRRNLARAISPKGAR